MVLLASDYDKSKYLKAEDVSHEKKFRIKSWTEDIVGMDRDKEKKLVIWFTNDERGLVVNKTNNRTIRGAFGDPLDGWIGKIIVIFPAMAEYRGTMKPALRVRIPPPKQAPQVAVPPKPAAPSGNGAAAAPPPPAAPVVDDPELTPDPTKPLAEDLDDEIPF